MNTNFYLITIILILSSYSIQAMNDSKNDKRFQGLGVVCPEACRPINDPSSQSHRNVFNFAPKEDRLLVSSVGQKRKRGRVRSDAMKAIVSQTLEKIRELVDANQQLENLNADLLNDNGQLKNLNADLLKELKEWKELYEQIVTLKKQN